MNYDSTDYEKAFVEEKKVYDTLESSLKNEEWIAIYKRKEVGRGIWDEVCEIVDTTENIGENHFVLIKQKNLNNKLVEID